MALGYCLVCEKLVPIKPGKHKPAPEFGPPQRWWWPVEHDKPEGGACIDGPKKPI